MPGSVHVHFSMVKESSVEQIGYLLNACSCSRYTELPVTRSKELIIWQLNAYIYKVILTDHLYLVSQMIGAGSFRMTLWYVRTFFWLKMMSIKIWPSQSPSLQNTYERFWNKMLDRFLYQYHQREYLLEAWSLVQFQRLHSVEYIPVCVLGVCTGLKPFFDFFSLCHPSTYMYDLIYAVIL